MFILSSKTMTPCFCLMMLFIFMGQSWGGTERTSACSCDGDGCRAVVRGAFDFQTAEDVCRDKGGVLMTVRSKESEDIVGSLLEGTAGDFWIGLHLSAGRCSDLSAPLRGYAWTAGGSDDARATPPTVIHWRGDVRVCAPRCVSLSKDNTWTERPCRDQVDGSLCEKLPRESSCQTARAEAQTLSDPSVFKRAETQTLSEPSVFKRAEAQTLSDPTVFKRVKRAEAQTLSDPNVVKSAVEQSISDPSFFKRAGNTPCADAPCDHTCTKVPGGYTCSCFSGHAPSGEDAHLCVLHCPRKRCPAVCDPSGTSCSCPWGFIRSENFCEDIDECSMQKQCDHACNNTFGGFFCVCPEGFVSKNRVNCVRMELVLTPNSTIATSTMTPATRGSFLWIVAVVAVAVVLLALVVWYGLTKRPEDTANMSQLQSTEDNIEC